MGQRSTVAEFQWRDNFTLVYPDGSYDAETLLIDPLTSDVWVVTKEVATALRLCAQSLWRAQN